MDEADAQTRPNPQSPILRSIHLNEFVAQTAYTPKRFVISALEGAYSMRTSHHAAVNSRDTSRLSQSERAETPHVRRHEVMLGVGGMLFGPMGLFLLQYLKWSLEKKNQRTAILPVRYPLIIILYIHGPDGITRKAASRK